MDTHHGRSRHWLACCRPPHIRGSSEVTKALWSEVVLPFSLLSEILTDRSCVDAGSRRLDVTQMSVKTCPLSLQSLPYRCTIFWPALVFVQFPAHLPFPYELENFHIHILFDTGM